MTEQDLELLSQFVDGELPAAEARVLRERLLAEPGLQAVIFARGGHGCGTLSACRSGLFFRAGNPAMCDPVTGEKIRLTHVTRPGCWINIIPAGGLILIPEASSGCTCNFGVQTSLALIPASLERGNDGIME